SKGGIMLTITATNPSNYLRNIRVIMPGGRSADDAFLYLEEAPADAPQTFESFEDTYTKNIFHPMFLDRLRSYKVLRYMDWMETNWSEQEFWADRPAPSNARWSVKGAPVEVMCDLANTLSADPWFCIPHLATDDYVEQFATIVRDRVSADLKIYIEYSNETWNYLFSQAHYALEQGEALGLNSNVYTAAVLFRSKRSVEIFQIFERVFGGTERLVRVMGSQVGSTWVSRELLSYNDAYLYTDAVAVAPYFGGYLGAPGELSRVTAMSLDQLFVELQTVALPQAIAWMQGQASVAAEFGVELVAYEGGQHLVGYYGAENDATLNALFDAANDDMRMGALYDTYLSAWQNAGGGIFIHFCNCMGYNKHGRWGSLRNMYQSREDAPKFDAIQRFIEAAQAENPQYQYVG
ncbi:MAG: hypothetical protein JXR94_09790, partial [Candidatus Hydrogenedentes bacterium]|nr:hypothetical protein [Candidatus Hydrogenedentota bacterium]